MRVTIDIPEELEEYAPHIGGLLRLQLAKLFVNAHKATPERRDVGVFIERMREEIVELESQLLENRLKGNALLEIADIANFALLSYIALRNEQMEHKGNVDERSRPSNGASSNILPWPEQAVHPSGTHVGAGFADL